MNPRSPLLAAALLLASSGCDDLADYRGQFRGDIVEGGFIRDCFGAEVTATLTFNPALAVAPLPPGLDSGEKNRLTTDDGTFQDTVLEPIAALPHDPLSKLDFPGAQRLHNYLLLARPERGPLAGRDAVVIVSLLEDERIELRVIARTAPGAEGCAREEAAADAGTDGGAAQGEARVHDYFGLFRLRPQ